MIAIIDYQARWTAEFDAIAQPLQHSLGSLALRIDHIGSTAVPLLCAKDVIDIQVSVAELSEAIVMKMKEAGFVFRADITSDHIPPNVAPNPNEWEKRYFNAPNGERRMHIHVRMVGNPNQRYPLIFRDYLIAHPHMAAAYGELKRRLAASLKDESAYADVKDPAVDLIYFAAEEWARQVGCLGSDSQKRVNAN